MNRAEKELLIHQVGTLVGEMVRDATAPLLRRIDELEARKPEKGEKGEPGEKGDAGKDGRDGVDGKDGADGNSVTVEDIRPLVAALVEEKFAAVELPRDGKDGRDGVDGKDGRDGKDAVDLAGAMIDRDGRLVLTLSDGKQCPLGPVVGPAGKDGKDGRDGFGFEDMSEEVAEDGRTIIRRYRRGDQEKEFRHALAVVIDQGVFKEGNNYKRGDGVTWGGNYWIAQKDTNQKPGGNDDWRIAVRRGRDGKDGAPGERGPEGRAGKDAHGAR